MDSIKEYIRNLNVDDIPWHRMITAYETAEKYPEYLSILDEMKDLEEVKKAWNSISDFEHQSTLYTPAPFAVVFLVRIYEKAKHTDNPVAIWLADKLLDEFRYYLEICNDAEKSEHADPLENMSDILNDKYLLPEGFDLDPEYDEDDDEEDIVDVDEFIAGLFPEDLFYSLYYYTGKILLETLEINDNGKLSDMKEKIKKFLE
ncbi:MAG: hypothetical protein K2K02_07085 [Ruminococcus sp.]|nr:hypothetical protein [Ruminococcus sp.]